MKTVKMNKKAQAGYGISWIYKLVLIVAITSGIVFTVLSHYSKNMDVREMESAVLSQKLARCVAPNGIVDEFSDSAVRKCIPIDDKNIYINASLKEDILQFGDDYFSKLCETMEQGVKITKYPSCNRFNYMVLDRGKAEKLVVFIAINKADTNL